MSNYRKQSVPAPANGRNAERAYGAEIRYAKLCHNEKALLRFYADVFYWEKGQCSEWSVHRISAHIGWTPKTTKGARDRLEELGWIVVHKRGYNKTHQIEVSYGSNDPRYDELGCSKWWKPEGAGSGGPLEVTIPIKGNQPVESDNYFEDQMLYGLPRCFRTVGPLKMRVSLKERTACPPHVDVSPRSSKTSYVGR